MFRSVVRICCDLTDRRFLILEFEGFLRNTDRHPSTLEIVEGWIKKIVNKSPLSTITYCVIMSSDKSILRVG
jgi:hypothetical protein